MNLDHRGEDDQDDGGSVEASRTWSRLHVHLAGARVHRRTDAHARRVRVPRREDTAGPG